MNNILVIKFCLAVAAVIADSCSNFWHRVVEPPPPWSLGTTYDVHLGLIGKRIVDFLLVSIELYSLGVTAEALRAKTDRKSAISLQRGQFDPKFQVEGVAPLIIFARIVRPMNALQLCRWQFSRKETLLQTFFKRSAILDGKWPFCIFETPFEEGA